MSSLKGLGILGTGTIGVLSSGLLISSVMNTGAQAIFGMSLMIFILAGAGALLLKSARF